jgi:hypothetical protein
MDPDSWGPRVWATFHSYAAKYPQHPDTISKTRAQQWYQQIVYKLPCGECAKKYKTLFECVLPLTPVDLASRDALFEWTVRLHNTVNMLLHKPVFDLTDARRLYFS